MKYRKFFDIHMFRIGFTVYLNVTDHGIYPNTLKLPPNRSCKFKHKYDSFRTCANLTLILPVIFWSNELDSHFP